jgi:hypothetical protein
MSDITIDNVGHSWRRGLADHRLDELVLHVQLAGPVTGYHREVMETDFRRTGFGLEFDGTQTASITGVKPRDVDRAVAALVQVVEDADSRVSTALRDRELANEQIGEAIQRGLAANSSQPVTSASG